MRTLLHIGVPKTGTTAVQAALTGLLAPDGDPSTTGNGNSPGNGFGNGFGNVPVNGHGHGHGITMPGTPAEQARAALAVLGQGQGWRSGEGVAGSRHWTTLVERARAAGGTVVVSSEFLCEADPAMIRQIADDLGRNGLRVVLTLRPLARILPSAWQQYLKSGHALPYEKWLRAVLARPAKPTVTPSFWRRHDHAAVIDRWADEVGADRLTVVVLDESDHGLLLRTFDDLLELPTGTLRAAPADTRNRSMTAAEAELIRQLNVVLRRTEMSWAEYAHLVRYGAILRAVQRVAPAAGASRTATPAWALERANEIGAGFVTAIDALRPAGLQVIGDLDRLAEPAEPDLSSTTAPTEVPIDFAVEALLGTLSRATVGTLAFPAEPGAETEARGLPGTEDVNPRRLTLDRVPSRHLADVLYERGRKSLRRRRRALLSRLPGSSDRPAG